MEPEKPKLVGNIRTEARDSRVTIDYRPRNVTMRYVSDQELETLGSASNDLSLHLGFFGGSLGIAVTSFVTLTTVEITNPRIFAAYWAIFVVTTIAAVYFFIKSILEYRESRRQLKAIREENSLGESGR